MNNNSVFPFERNRYFAGKMLTSSDFAAEQEYINNKRRFLNNLMYGSGIVCGCGVYSLDDLSLFVESGFAIDRLGREVIIENSVVKKLSAIEGFDQINSNKLTLCMRYKEENVHPVYSVNRQKSDSEYEYNRIQEGYELFFVATEDIVNTASIDTEFLTNGVLYQDDNYAVMVEMPATVCVNNYARLRIKVVKLSDSLDEFSFKGCIQLPAFSVDDAHELCVEFEKLNLSIDECVTKDYWVFVRNNQITETELILKDGRCNVVIHDEEIIAFSDFALKILVSDITPRALVDRELGRVSLELHGMGEIEDFICLADITLIRTDSAYIIEKINELKVKKYIETPSGNILRNEYLDYFKEENALTVTYIKDNEVINNIPIYDTDSSRIKVATGIVEIPIGEHAKAGDVFYSGEIMHGLGVGNVYVEVGQELIENSGVTGANTKSTIYGDASLFKTGGAKGPETDTAVKVLNDKGSFVVAAGFKKDYDCLMLTYRWIAIKMAGYNDETDNPGDKQWIEAETPTIVLGTSESRYIGIKFHNMDKCSIGYEVLEKNSGDVTIDGVYTAPNKEGVYEIKVSCIEKPQICTYVYVIVKKK